MKKLIAAPAILILSSVVFYSCTKSSSKDFAPPVAASPDRIINAKVTPGVTYSVEIDNIGELSIRRQALNFKISQATNDPKTGSLIYNYLPADGFKGADEVVLEHKTEYIYNTNSTCNYGSNAAIGTRISLIAIKITVAE